MLIYVAYTDFAHYVYWLMDENMQSLGILIAESRNLDDTHVDNRELYLKTSIETR